MTDESSILGFPASYTEPIAGVAHPAATAAAEHKLASILMKRLSFLEKNNRRTKRASKPAARSKRPGKTRGIESDDKIHVHHAHPVKYW